MIRRMGGGREREKGILQLLERDAGRRKYSERMMTGDAAIRLCF